MNPEISIKHRSNKLLVSLLVGVAALTAATTQASAQETKRPNVVILISLPS